ncbi:MAG: TOBE domain-containing protein [Desulfobacterales bacterium]|jgi:molybdate transport system regulatory protein|nr:TOBE domain-containing protein [Desulfobacterales bacterium]
MNLLNPRSAASNQGRVRPGPGSERCLDALQLDRIEKALRAWAGSDRRLDLTHSRRRVFLIFLLIRYTGARLNEVLRLQPAHDFDPKKRTVRFRKGSGSTYRDVQIPEAVSAEIQRILMSLGPRDEERRVLELDPAHVRRKFYEQAETVGLPRELGAPEVIRRSRAVELMQGNVPLPVVQKILGHSTPNLAAAYVNFSEEDMRRAEAFFVDRENRRKTSARNAFFGKIETIRTGDVQAQVEIATPGGYRICTVITHDSLKRLGLKPGILVAAEVKAPWVTVHRCANDPECSADNVLSGTVERIAAGRVTSEIVARIADGTEICSIVTAPSLKRLGLRPGDRVWVAFNAFTVVLHAD